MKASTSRFPKISACRTLPLVGIHYSHVLGVTIEVQFHPTANRGEPRRAASPVPERDALEHLQLQHASLGEPGDIEAHVEDGRVGLEVVDLPPRMAPGFKLGTLEKTIHGGWAGWPISHACHTAENEKTRKRAG